MLKKVGTMYFLRFWRIRVRFHVVRATRAPRSFAPASELAPIFTTFPQA